MYLQVFILLVLLSNIRQSPSYLLHDVLFIFFSIPILTSYSPVFSNDSYSYASFYCKIFKNECSPLSGFIASNFRTTQFLLHKIFAKIKKNYPLFKKINRIFGCQKHFYIGSKIFKSVS